MRYILTAALLVTVAGFQSAAQQTIEKDVPALLRAYGVQHFQEKIFVHTNKTFYLCGEIIWFKLYNVDALLNKPVDVSKVAYVELLSSDHRAILQAKIELNLGSGNGSFMLPFSLGSGVYTLRAYTNWMKNFSPELFFETSLTVINSLKKLPPIEKDSGGFDIRFYPEGGNLVQNIQSRIAFHAVGRDGKGIACNGKIVNQRGDSLAGFQSQRFGMGSFNFTPLGDNAYRAVITTPSGETIIRDLPAAFKNGYVIKVSTPDKEHIKVSVFSSYQDSDPVFLLVHTRQVIKKADSKSVVNGQAEFILPKAGIAAGISHFTLFNGRREPVCERLFFQAPEEKLNIAIATDQEQYALRKKVQLAVTTQDTAAATADLSLAVFRIDSLTTVPADDIQSYLWLSSELKGRIESPSYYFNSADAEETVDQLMLTQGWSRFKWEDVLTGKKPAFRFIPEYEGPVITGTIHERFGGAPAKNIETYLTVPGQKFLFKTCTSNNSGNFIFNLNKFYGNNEVIIQASDKIKTAYNIDVATPFSTDFSSRKYAALQLPEKWREQLSSYSVETQVENMFVQDSTTKFYSPGMRDTTAFYSIPDKTYWLDDYTRFITMEEVMREYVTEVRVRKQPENFTYQVLNIPSKLFFDNGPLVLIDGLPVFDLKKIIDFNPLKIKKLDVVARKYFSGNNVFDGIVSYRTYKGDLDGFQLDPAALVLDYPGMQLQREFYSPVYETPTQAKTSVPDFRNLLFWAPLIKTTGKEKSDLSFYTSDRPGRYAVVVQGLNSNGLAGSKVVYFTVGK